MWVKITVDLVQGALLRYRSIIVLGDVLGAVQGGVLGRVEKLRVDGDVLASAK